MVHLCKQRYHDTYIYTHTCKSDAIVVALFSVLFTLYALLPTFSFFYIHLANFHRIIGVTGEMETMQSIFICVQKVHIFHNSIDWFTFDLNNVHAFSKILSIQFVCGWGCCCSHRAAFSTFFLFICSFHLLVCRFSSFFFFHSSFEWMNANAFGNFPSCYVCQCNCMRYISAMPWER